MHKKYFKNRRNRCNCSGSFVIIINEKRKTKEIGVFNVNIAICNNNGALVDIMVGVCRAYAMPEDQIKGFVSSKKLKEYLLNDKPEIDLFIIDINMMEVSGIELRDIISKMYRDTSIIFATDDESNMSDAFGKKVIGFLPKSDFDNRIGDIIIQVRKEITDDRKIQIADGQKNIELSQKKIFSISAQRIYTMLKYVEYYNVDTGEIRMKEQLYRIPLWQWEDTLDMEKFVRISRSNLVSWRYVKDVTDRICMENEDFYPIPRGKKRQYREMFNQYRIRER